MSLSWIWFGLAVLALIGEVLSGTFYLLVIAAAFGLAGLGAWFGLTWALQMVIVAVTAMLGIFVLRRLGILRKVGRTDDRRDANVNMDIGQPIQIDAWREDGTARARHRGAEWEVKLVPDAPRAPGMYTIVEVRGSQFLVTPRVDAPSVSAIK
jgi:membrane protein implicated in regulation of membrane protease activity